MAQAKLHLAKQARISSNDSRKNADFRCIAEPARKASHQNIAEKPLRCLIEILEASTYKKTAQYKCTQ